MRVAIVVPDDLVVVDGVSHTVDCSALTGVHAVQWYDTHGDVEYELVDGEKQPNEAITDLGQFDTVLSGLI